jgi:hypothetical protein
MKKNSSTKFGSAIPEVRSFITKYGCRLRDNPPYVLLGQYNSKAIGPVMGILAAADNEFHAYLLRREFRKNGHCNIERTEYHSGKPTFSIETYKRKMREKMKMEQQKKEAE